MGQAPSSPDRSTLIAFVAAVVMGGANFIAVRFSNQELPPLFGAMLRFGGATALFFLIMVFGRFSFPRGRALLGAVLYGVLGFGIAYALLYFALVGLSAGMSSAIIASVPLTTLLLAVLHGQEKFSIRGVVGGVLAVAGIAALSTSAFYGEVRAIYFISSLLATVAIAESSIVAKGFPRTHPITTNAIGMGVGTVFLAIASLLFKEEWTVPQEASTWVALTYLVVPGSVLLFVLYLFVMSRWTASATNYAVTCMPVVAVTLGVLIADETVTWQLLLGAALVVTAVYVGALSQQKAPAPVAPEPAP